MNYQIILKNPAKKFIKRLDDHIKKRIIKKINLIRQDPRAGIPFVGNLKGLWKMRDGEYRIIYQIIQNELTVYVININHRKKSYKR